VVDSEISVYFSTRVVVDNYKSITPITADTMFATAFPRGESLSVTIVILRCEPFSKAIAIPKTVIQTKRLTTTSSVAARMHGTHTC